MAMMNQVRDLYDQAVDNLSADNLKSAQRSIQSGAGTMLDAARSNPKTTAAVIFATGLAAAALWVLREPRRLAAIKRGISERMGRFASSSPARRRRRSTRPSPQE